MAITSALCTSFKKEIMQAGHLLQGQVFIPGTVVTSGNNVITASSLAGLAIGMLPQDANLTAVGLNGAIIVRFNSATTLTVNITPTGNLSSTTTQWKTRVMFCALIKIGMAGTYGAASTNYTNITGNSDEVTGTGYTTGGFNLTSVSSVITTVGSGINFTFGINPTWTSASFSTAGAMIYRNSNVVTASIDAVSGNSVAVMDFGGTQTVTNGTFTILITNVSNLLVLT